LMRVRRRSGLGRPLRPAHAVADVVHVGAALAAHANRQHAPVPVDGGHAAAVVGDRGDDARDDGAVPRAVLYRATAEELGGAVAVVLAHPVAGVGGIAVAAAAVVGDLR